MGALDLSTPIARVNVLGVRVSAINMPMAVETLDNWIASREPHYVCVTNVYGVMESQRDTVLREIHNSAGLVTPDGMPLVWISRLRGQRHVSRVYGPDLMLAMCERSLARGYRHYLYGGAAEVPAKLAARLQSRFPGLKVAGMHSPPFRSLSADEDEQVTRLINQAAPDIVWVGLGTPKQERWMAAHVGKLTAPVLIGVGAAFDFHAGVKRQAPPVIQRCGFEWLFRLATEPQRLWRRYLINNPRFIIAVAMQMTGLRRYDGS